MDVVRAELELGYVVPSQSHVLQKVVVDVERMTCVNAELTQLVELQQRLEGRAVQDIASGPRVDLEFN